MRQMEAVKGMADYSEEGEGADADDKTLDSSKVDTRTLS